MIIDCGLLPFAPLAHPLSKLRPSHELILHHETEQTR